MCSFRKNIRFDDSKDANRHIELIRNLADNTRICANNGFTPAEMEKIGYGK